MRVITNFIHRLASLAAHPAACHTVSPLQCKNYHIRHHNDNSGVSESSPPQSQPEKYHHSNMCVVKQKVIVSQFDDCQKFVDRGTTTFLAYMEMYLCVMHMYTNYCGTLSYILNMADVCIYFFLCL